MLICHGLCLRMGPRSEGMRNLVWAGARLRCAEAARLEEASRLQRRRHARYRFARLLWGVAKDEQCAAAAAVQAGCCIPHAGGADRPSNGTQSLFSQVRSANMDETRRRGPNRVRTNVVYRLPSALAPHRPRRPFPALVVAM